MRRVVAKAEKSLGTRRDVAKAEKSLGTGRLSKSLGNKGGWVSISARRLLHGQGVS